MSGDVLLLALAKAGEAARIEACKPGRCGEGTGCEIGPCYCSTVAAHAAIVAFLSRVADVHAGAYAGMDARGVLKHLAAAVAAAAGKDG